MEREKCRVCGRPRLSKGNEGQGWICKNCREKAEQFMDNFADHPQSPCRKCKLLNRGACPFPPDQRKRVVYCNKFEHKDAEHNRRRWAKFEEIQ